MTVPLIVDKFHPPEHCTNHLQTALPLTYVLQLCTNHVWMCEVAADVSAVTLIHCHFFLVSGGIAFVLGSSDSSLIFFWLPVSHRHCCYTL